MPDTLDLVAGRWGMVTVLSAMGAMVVVAGAVGCSDSSGFSRDEVRDLWVGTYARQFQITDAQAACIVDGFFAELDDELLRPLTKGAELSDAQAARIGELAVSCGVGGSVTG